MSSKNQKLKDIYWNEAEYILTQIEDLRSQIKYLQRDRDKCLKKYRYHAKKCDTPQIKDEEPLPRMDCKQ